MSDAPSDAAVSIVPLPPGELDRLEPLWTALHRHHERITPRLGGAPVRGEGQSWSRRRAQYERWLTEPGAFALVADRGGEAVGYALVTIGDGLATWRTGERIAKLETLSVLPAERGRGVGDALLDEVERRLRAAGVAELQVTSTTTNADAHRLYERRGLTPAFVTFHGSVADAD